VIQITSLRSWARPYERAGVMGMECEVGEDEGECEEVEADAP
jgi:hypothetical protein